MRNPKHHIISEDPDGWSRSHLPQEDEKHENRRHALGHRSPDGLKVEERNATTENK